MTFDEFKNVMRKARTGQRITYHQGNLAEDRTHDGEVDLIARFVTALYELDVARLYHHRNDYFVCLTKRLKVRKDLQGSFQEAERLMIIC